MTRGTTTSGAWRRRVLRYYLPLALVSAAALVLWLNLPLFQGIGHQVRSQPAGHQNTAQTGHTGQPAAHAGGHQAEAQPGDHQSSAHAADPSSSATSSGDHAGSVDGSQNRLLLARLTDATGYIALGLLAFTLLVGPANLLLRRRAPVSHYLRRDAGMWTAFVSVVHVVTGLQVHGPPGSLGQRLQAYFFAAGGGPSTTRFGLANWTGLAAMVLVVGLLATSSNFALRKLKARSWKRLQRLNYAVFVLVVAHAIFYGALARATSPYALLLDLSVAAVFVGQAAGIWLWRRRHARPLPQPG